MQRNLLRRAASGRVIAGTLQVGILASQIIAETATGDSGPGLLYDEALLHTGKQLRAKITSWSGTPGTLFVYENGSILVEGQGDGAYAIGYDWEAWAADGSLITGSDTASVAVGAVNATAPGADVTGTGSVSGGDASGQGDATAPGADTTGAGTVSAGDATGGTSGDASAPGANTNGDGTVSAGSVSVEQNATAPGADVSGSGSISAGGTGNAQLLINPRYIIKAKPRNFIVRR